VRAAQILNGIRTGCAVAVASLCLAAPAPAHAEPGFAAKFLDGFIVRPLLLVPTLVTSTLGVGIYPISFLTGTDRGTTYYLIEVPVAYLRARPLGNFSTPQLYEIPAPGERK
jgi:hypothetical protein